MDPLKAFMDDLCVVSGEYTCASLELYTAYAEWMKQAGEQHILTHKDFSKRLNERGFSCQRMARGVRWQGIGLLDKDNPGLV
jgi:phage/plasmid-associated DNA primase